MADFPTALRRSLVDRAGALGTYVQSLQSRNTRTDSAFTIALEMYRRYSLLFVRQVEQDWSRARFPDRTEDILLGWAQRFFEKEKFFDTWFTRGSQGDVPRAIKTLARRALQVNGLNDDEPVLTVGPPDNFEVLEAEDLHEFLFGELFRVRDERDLADLPIEVRLWILSVPYIEGTRTLWIPIVLGHEIGHLRVVAERNGNRLLDPTVWIDLNFELRTLLEEEEEGAGLAADVGQLERSRRELRDWVTEMLCDLNAVRLYGPAGLCAIAEFLALAEQGNKAQSPDTHPPLPLRIAIMVEFLRAHGEALPPYAEPWVDYEQRWLRRQGDAVADARAARDADRRRRLEQLVRDHASELFEQVLSWGEQYKASKRSVQIAWIVTELLEGIPGGTHCNHAAQRGVELHHADVVAAAWEARYALEYWESWLVWRQDLAPEAWRAATPKVVPRLLRDRIETNDVTTTSDGAASQALLMQERRVQIDQLALKALDSVELATLWAMTGGTIHNNDSAFPAILPSTGPGAILSETAIRQRFDATGDDRLVLTPLLADAIGPAGIDLRLSPDFIVFRHSATSSFDPLNPRQDPRVMQERVEKAWGEPFILHPGELVLASTLEYVVLPPDIAGQVVTRSSYGRLGLITATAVQIQPGSRGAITLELVNHGETPLALTPGVRVAQLVLFSIDRATAGAGPDKYRYPTGPEFSKVQNDEDAVALRELGDVASRQSSRRMPAPGARGEIWFRAVLEQRSALRLHAACVLVGIAARLNPQLPDGDQRFHYQVDVITHVDAFVELLLRLTQTHSYGVRAVAARVTDGAGPVRLDVTLTLDESAGVVVLQRSDADDDVDAGDERSVGVAASDARAELYDALRWLWQPPV